jgi:pantoate--beta-alanine ligase
MQVIKSIKELGVFVDLRLLKGQEIGFVPTMGALHDGHISLIRRSLSENHCTIASVFVNPTQFNDPKDFSKYPRQLTKDAQMLLEAGCDALFAPTVEEMYPRRDETIYNLAPIDAVLEGAFRPGHFNGVASVVKRLLELVKPTRAYFGLKDYQQYLIVKILAERYHLPTEIVGCEIVREREGLALSSRNQLLSDNGKAIAQNLSAALHLAKELGKTASLDTAEEMAREMLMDVDGLDLEYFQIVDRDTLQPFSERQVADAPAIALVAARVEGVRLIDNMIIR